MATQIPPSPDEDLLDIYPQECRRLRLLLRAPTDLAWSQSSNLWYAFAKSVAIHRQRNARAGGATDTIPDEAASRLIERIMTWKDGPGGSSLPHLAAAIWRGHGLVGSPAGSDSRQAGTRPDPEDMAREALRLSDPELIGAMRSYVQFAIPGVIRQVFGGLTPEKQRIRRALRRHIRKSSDVHLVREFSRGVFVCTCHSEFSLPPVGRSQLADCLPRSGRSLASIVRILGNSLRPGENHGGYLYLQELVDLCEERFRVLWNHNGDAGHAELEPIDRARAREWMEICGRILDESLVRLGREIERQRRPGDTGIREEIRSSWREVVQIYFAQIMGVSDPEWDGASVRAIALKVIPNLDRDEYRRWHQGRMEYLIRRVRDEMMRRFRAGGSLAAQ